MGSHDNRPANLGVNMGSQQNWHGTAVEVSESERAAPEPGVTYYSIEPKKPGGVSKSAVWVNSVFVPYEPCYVELFLSCLMTKSFKKSCDLCGVNYVNMAQTIKMNAEYYKYYKEIQVIKKPVFAEEYAEETIEIADTDDNASRGRSRVTARQWMAGRLDPLQWGDRLQTENKTVVVEVDPEQLNRMTEQERTNAYARELGGDVE